MKPTKTFQDERMLQLFESPVPKFYPAVLPTSKTVLGQHMTPTPIAAFMASLFSKTVAAFHLVDAGAGEVSLTRAFLKALWRKGKLRDANLEIMLEIFATRH